MTVPNFFVVGAPKCGTSALYHHLRMHPQIFMAQPKETNFFATDLTSPNFIHDEDRYRQLFAEASGKPRIGEASVWYLYSKTAAAGIKKMSPHARIVAMLRNPVEMIHSYHSQRIWNRTEDIKNFKSALDAIPDRMAGKHLPKNPYPIECLNYLDIANYPEQLQRYFEAFGEENVKVIIFDDFKQDPMRTYREVFAFLDVDADVDIDHDDSAMVRNANKRPKNESISRLLRNPPGWVSRMGRFLIPNPDKRQNFWRRLRRMNVEWKPREQLERELRVEIVEHYRPTVATLGDMLNRDLTAIWH